MPPPPPPNEVLQNSQKGIFGSKLTSVTIRSAAVAPNTKLSL